jgi:hypothetical protein
VDSFVARAKHINCFDITDMDWKASTKRRILVNLLKYFIKGGPVLCFGLTARYAPVAFKDINSTVSEKRLEVPSSPVSCAAVLARKMGASDQHAVMAAGFAGGIGLSGGACGALAAAVWIMGMKNGMDENANFGFTPPGAMDAMDSFLKSTDYEFECSKIVGRKFENVTDHAEYVCNGGCAKIIDGLASRK